VIDDTLYPNYAKLEGSVNNIEKIIVRRTTDQTLPEGTIDLQEILTPPQTNRTMS
jgi:hypothetical protein